MARIKGTPGRMGLRLAGFGILSLWISGSTCVQPQETDKVVKNCVISDDQLGTVYGRWTITPVPIAFRSGHFSQSEREAIVRAAKTWNTFYNKSRGFSLIDADVSRTSSIDLTGTGICGSSPIIDGESFTGQVKIYKRSSGWPYDDGFIALTTVCRSTDPTSSLKRSFNAILESNHENFYGANSRIPDLETIFLHEFGHLVGMDHSCTPGSTQQGMPNCDILPSTHAYRLAVLYPNFSFFNGLGEVKRILMDNDMDRANCLYE